MAKSISDNIVFEDEKDEEDERWQDNGQLLLIPLAFLFLFCFRKGWALNLIIICLGFSSCSESKKNNKEEFKFVDLWYSQEYQAQLNYDDEKYLKAAIGFNEPMRKGVAYYKAGDYLSAQSAFEKDTSINGLNNLALTYAKLGKLDKSKEIFELLLEKDPNNKSLNSNLQQINLAQTAIDSLGLVENEFIEESIKAENSQNDSPEDLSGGGQEAKKKDMEKERKEETVETEKRKGKELDELPDDFKAGKGEIPNNILMRKVDDDPSIFLRKKMNYQVKKGQVEVLETINKW